MTTRSLAALKLYLDAERNLRAAQYDSAIAGFQRAIEADSSFALAHYRLAVAGLFVGRMGLIEPAIERALALAQRLIERDRRLLAAFAALVRGKPDQAEQQYRDREPIVRQREAPVRLDGPLEARDRRVELGGAKVPLGLEIELERRRRPGGHRRRLRQPGPLSLTPADQELGRRDWSSQPRTAWRCHLRRLPE